jgi:D-sedoheptulose 7-phosphate isomerase
MKTELNEHIDLFRSLDEHEAALKYAAEKSAAAISSGRKIMFAGNGGSAADAQHLAAELVGRLQHERRALPGLALSTDSSALTCIGNDYGFNYLFSRQIEGLGQDGDVALLISTSGNSQNLIEAAEIAKKKEIFTVGFLGKGGGALLRKVDLPITVRSESTARIQEAHIFMGHIFCSLVEQSLGLVKNN